jgi:hypothetical protein
MALSVSSSERTYRRKADTGVKKYLLCRENASQRFTLSEQAALGSPSPSQVCNAEIPKEQICLSI